MSTQTFNIENLIRPTIKALTPYRCARHDHATGVLLDANENAFGSPIELLGLSLNRYPDPYQTPLRARVATLMGLAPENIFAGVGSDEAIDLLVRIACEPGRDSIIITSPTYGMYRVAAEAHGVHVRSCLLTQDFQLDLNALRAATDMTTKMIFCCSPNNPTGNILRRDDIVKLCATTHALVVVDEAYIDFADAPSLAGAVPTIPNLVVLRTLSKAWGLAGIRLGFALADPALIAYLMKIKSPYNVNSLTISAAMQALDRRSVVDERVRTLVAERERLASAFRAFPFISKVFPSDANFVLIRCTDARAVYEHLAQGGIIVRDRSTESLLEQCLRITVGTPEQNNALLQALKEYTP
jgi:histidinol-phosphate aminotransferase